MSRSSGLRSRLLQNLIAACGRERKKIRTFARPGEGPRPFARSCKCSDLVKILENWTRNLHQFSKIFTRSEHLHDLAKGRGPSPGRANVLIFFLSRPQAAIRFCNSRDLSPELLDMLSTFPYNCCAEHTIDLRTSENVVAALVANPFQRRDHPALSS